MSGNLGIVTVAESQASKHTTVNTALLRLALAITETLEVSVASGNATVTTEQYQTSLHFRATGAATSGRTVTLPQVERLVIVSNASGSDSVAFVRGSTSISIAAGGIAMLWTDGTTNGLTKMLESIASGASALLDGIGSTRGSLLYRGASAWAALAPGTSGQVLQTNGAGADPSWAAGGGGGGSADAVCKVVMSSNLSVANSTWTRVDFDTELFDDAAIHSTSSNTSRLTVPSGYTRARLKAKAVWENNNSGSFRIINIEKNTAGSHNSANSIDGAILTPRDNTPMETDSGWIGVSTGDYFEMFVFQDSGAARNLIGPTGQYGRAYFQIELRA